MFRLSRLCLLFFGLAFVIAPQPAHATVVFSNMPNAATGVDFLTSAGQSTAVIFDVPVGANYQINSVQTEVQSLSPSSPITARIHADGAGLPGAVVVDLGTQLVPTGVFTVTFSPVGSAILTNGNRYWIVFSTTGPDIVSRGTNLATIPTGVFTFVDSGGITTINTFVQRTYRLMVSIDADAIVVPSNGVVACANSDGRVNSICTEPEQTAAVYCRTDGSITVYGITDSAGWLAFHATQSDIDEVGIPAQNTLIAASTNGAIRLYRLTTGEFQVNAPMLDAVRGNLPDGYTFIWSGCS